MTIPAAYPNVQLLINNEWRDARGGATMPVHNPADGGVIGTVAKLAEAGVVPGAPVLLRVWSQALGAPAGAASAPAKEAAPLMRGRIREVAASNDPVTRTYAVKVAVDAGVALPLGATVYVRPDTAGLTAPAVIKLPTTALWRDGPATVVWVLDPANMTVKSQRVEIATADGNDAVVASGLQPGQVVVSAGVHVLAPGEKVSIYKPASSAALK